MNELVSIIVPVYNSEKYIKETIESIKKQTYKNWELILVDDKSTDKSIKLIEEFKEERIKLLKLERNSGAAVARNTGIEIAKGRYITFLDSDDFWEYNKLEKQVEFMKEKECAFSFSGYQFVDKNGKKNGKIVNVPKTLKYKQALKNTTISTITVMLDMKKLSKEDIKMPNVKNEDSATWWKILRKGYIAFGINEVLSYYRRHENTASSNKVESIKNTWKLYRKNENLSIIKSMYYFNCYIINAIKRRI